MKYETYRLSDVCKFIDYRGKTPPKTAYGIPLITAKIIKNGFIQEPQEFIKASYYDEWMPRGDKSQIMSYPVAFTAKQAGEFSATTKPILQQKGKSSKNQNY